MQIRKVKKRDGRIVAFDKDKIVFAIYRAARAVGKNNRKKAQKLGDEVIKLLEENAASPIPSIEEIQDYVERVLIKNNLYDVAKAYIIYRYKRENMRNAQHLFSNIDLVDDYLDVNDWRVKENANMDYSLQGLNFHISSIISSQYWLNRIYPEAVKNAHINGDFHIHDLGTLSVYCVGWDLQDLLRTGFRGAKGKIESRPPKHLRTALGQAINFFYTLQGESAGAQAFSNFDTLLAPFIRYDNLNYKQVKQALQEFVYNINVPTRVGFQCMSEDTEILTPSGWKTYEEIEEGDIIKTFNLEKQEIENKKVRYVFRKKYNGPMYNLKNRIQDQLISPKHRVIRKKFQTDEYVMEPIEDILKLKSPFIVPVAANNSKKDIDISDEQIKLMAWIIGEGSIERPGKNYRSCYRVSIYQSENKKPENYKEIKALLKHFNLKFSEYTQKALGEPVKRLRLDAKSSKVIHKWFNTRESVGFIPSKLTDMSQRQSELFLRTYIKAEGFEGCKIATTDIDICDKLQAIASNAGYGSTVLTKTPTIGTKPIFVIRLIKHKDTYIQQIKKVDYSGVIWCPNTENETVIARRNGKVFITGNTPFTNITMDLKVPKFMKDEPVIIGGKTQEQTYSEFQKEMDMFNRAFAEVMSEGDANGRVFTFPIPTYNITEDFDWDNENLRSLWEMTSKYGIPYFSNFVNSDMSPDDVRSMCCRLRLDNRELRSRGGGLFGSNPLTGSIGVVTINLARLGYLAKSEEEFFDRLSHLMDLAQQSLVIKRKTLENLTESGLFPYSKFYLRDIKKRFNQYWKNHFSTIGLIGMNECCLNFLGSSIGEEEGKSFALKVLDFMRDKLAAYQENTGDIYNLEATPAESTSYRLAKIDRRKFPDIIVANNSEVSKGAEPYYTNSSQLPVYFTDDLFEALDLQDPLQVKYTGGTVFHIFAGEQKIPVESVKALVRKVAHNYHLPYFTLSPTFSICPEHGYIYGEHHKCPKCAEKSKDTECEVFSRIVGYLRPVKQWNDGKKAEFSQRKLYDTKILEIGEKPRIETD